MAERDPNDDRFLERIMRYLEDDLSEQGVATLQQELADDPRKREIFSLICLSDTLAHDEMPMLSAANPVIDEHPEPAGSMHETMILPAIEADDPESSDDPFALSNLSPRKKQRSWLRLGRWAAVFAIAITAFLLWHSSPKRAIAATVLSTVDAHWNGPADGAVLHPHDSFDLQSGCVALRFSDGTQLVAEGPAKLTCSGPAAVELSAGKISVKMPAGHNGFSVVTPDCRVTDLGTEFGVDAAAAFTDVHVFSGKVKIETAAPAGAQIVPIGGLAHVSAGRVLVTLDTSLPQLFVQDLSQSTMPLELADLLSGGNGTEEHRGGVLDPGSGAFGIWGTLDPWYDKSSDKPATADATYHRTIGLPVVDGCFIPAKTATPQPIDSAGDCFHFPNAVGTSSMRLCVAGNVAPLPGGKTITPVLNGTNYSFAGHSYVMVCPDIGFTLNLSAIRHLHPGGQLTRFRCQFGNLSPANQSGMADILVLIDGVQRFAQPGFTAQAGTVAVDIPLNQSDHFLTIATTGGGAGNSLLIGDAYLDQAKH